MKKWIKCPFPGEKDGEGKWFECNTTYLRWLFKTTKLPTKESEENPND